VEEAEDLEEVEETEEDMAMEGVDTPINTTRRKGRMTRKMAESITKVITKGKATTRGISKTKIHTTTSIITDLDPKGRR